MDRCVVANNAKGGILLDGATFEIANTTVKGNGPGDDAGTTWGGMRVKNLPASEPKLLTLVTVQDNNNTGISCAGTVAGTNVSASGNAGGVDITTGTCGFSSCGLPGPTCGAQP
jgi:hypothetical protein